jgi:hypothetical protein
MEKRVTCFMPYQDIESLRETIHSLEKSGIISKMVVIAAEDQTIDCKHNDVTYLKANNFSSSSVVKIMAEITATEYAMIYSKGFLLDLGRFCLQRMIQVCEDTDAGMVYSDYYENKNNVMSLHPVIDYQEGSLRDDFNFGSVLLFRTSALKDAAENMVDNFLFAGFYDLRLKVSQKRKIVHIQEPLYTEIEPDIRKTGEKQFDYVDPKNRTVQIEMETACTDHLKKIKGWLKPEFEPISFSEGSFPTEASVIIPVRNRVKTIGDAITSVLSQKSKYSFNLIVIDNYSSDGTTEVIRSFTEKDERVIHIIPERKDLGIGGCWNEGIFSDKCGKFAIQLDSDDLYIDDSVITRVVDAFYAQQCAMVVGTYKMVNFNLQDIPPGIINHKEWTPENGRNNALRINGLGAPRAFYVPVLRKIRIPNVSYGEDYAVGLAISRNYQIGRIYDPLYLCRRWDENSDASLDITKTNNYNYYKDKIRTTELLARKQKIAGTKK